METYTFNTNTWESEEVDLSKYKASLTYIVSSRSVRATQRDKNQNKTFYYSRCKGMWEAVSSQGLEKVKNQLAGQLRITPEDFLFQTWSCFHQY